MSNINSYNFSSLAINKLFLDSYEKYKNNELTSGEMYNSRNKGIKILLSAVELELYSILAMKDINFLITNDADELMNIDLGEEKRIRVSIYEEHRKATTGELPLTELVQRISLTFLNELEDLDGQLFINDLFIEVDFDKDGELTEQLITLDYYVIV